MALLLCKESALEELVGVPQFAQVVRNPSEETQVFVTLANPQVLFAADFRFIEQKQATRQLDRNFGRLRKAGPEYAMNLSPKKLNVDLMRAIFEAAELIETRIVEVCNYPAFVQMPIADYNKVVPAFLPNSRIPEVDENGDPVLDGNGDPVEYKVRWNEWKDDTHHHLEIGGLVNIPLNSHTGSQDVAGSYLVDLMQRYDPNPDEARTVFVKPMSEYPVEPE